MRGTLKHKKRNKQTRFRRRCGGTDNVPNIDELKQQLIETSQNCKTVKKYRLYGKKTENFVSQSI